MSLDFPPILTIRYTKGWSIKNLSEIIEILSMTMSAETHDWLSYATRSLVHSYHEIIKQKYNMQKFNDT